MINEYLWRVSKSQAEICCCRCCCMFCALYVLCNGSDLYGSGWLASWLWVKWKMEWRIKQCQRFLDLSFSTDIIPNFHIYLLLIQPASRSLEKRTAKITFIPDPIHEWDYAREKFNLSRLWNLPLQIFDNQSSDPSQGNLFRYFFPFVSNSSSQLDVDSFVSGIVLVQHTISWIMIAKM